MGGITPIGIDNKHYPGPETHFCCKGDGRIKGPQDIFQCGSQTRSFQRIEYKDCDCKHEQGNFQLI
jgi:hypothetical protein